VLAAYAKQPKSAAATQTLADFQKLWGQFTGAIAGIAKGQPPTIDFNVVVPGMEAAAEKLSQIENSEAQDAVNAAHAVYHSAQMEVVVALVVGLVVAVILALAVAGSVTRRLRPVSEAMEAVAAGDLTRTVPVQGTDEIGAMALAVNRATAGVRDTISALAGSAEQLAHSSDQLSNVTHDIVSSVESVGERARSADSSAELVSQNLNTISAGADEMAASIRQIAESANQGAEVASHAVNVVGTTNRTVSKLGESSQEIGDVVKVITSIAEQTNLLALNATIEAARAGDAGKGFAVVAGEVKDLAQETAKATEDISQRVQAIQADTESAVAAISQISEIIEQINNYQTTIAAAVEEQTATTGEMNRNVSNAASGAGEIARSIADVSGAAENTTRSVETGRQAATELSQISTELRRLVSHFRV
jgi:methyl-accepting chemotaxis protein